MQALPGGRYVQVAARLGLALALLALAPADARAGEVHLVVLHTNDVHGQLLPRRATWRDEADPPLVGGLARVAAYVRAVRAEHVGPGRGLLLVDGGDWYAGTPEGAVDHGLPFVEAMALLGYDALTLGNHELDHGVGNARRLAAAFGGAAVCANVIDRATGEPVDWVEPYRIVEAAGLRVALVGLVTTRTPVITHEDARTRLDFEDPVAALRRVRAALDALPEPPDLVVPVTHVGVDADRAIAAAFPDLPLVVGGHGHKYLDHGVAEGGTLIVQAGERATVVGRVDLVVDDETLAVVRAEARLVALDAEPEAEHRDARVEERCAALAEASDARMAEVVGALTEPLGRTFDRVTTSPACAWIADVIRARTGADVAIMNRGGVRTSLPDGPVARRDLFELTPFDNWLVTMSLTGVELESCLARAWSGAHSGVDLSGAVVELEPGGRRPRLARVLVAGEPLDPARTYRVATNSFLAAGGDGYEELERGRERVADAVILRDLLAEELLARGSVTPPTDERVFLVELAK